MALNNRFRLILLLLATALLCSACQSLIPSAQGLVTSSWQANEYARQDHIEVQWKQQSFSFLLYQQQQGQHLNMVALSLTGQQLFQLSFDGKHVQVEQRIEAMKLLPFDYVVRDLLYATYPNFAALQQKVRINESVGQRIIIIQDQNVLSIADHQDGIELNNLQVPYQMMISSVPNTLEDDEDGYAAR